jgi:hypothetical protein
MGISAIRTEGLSKRYGSVDALAAAVSGNATSWRDALGA